MDYWKPIDSNIPADPENPNDPIDPEQCEIAQELVRDLEKHLDLEQTRISFIDEWSKHPPDGVDTLSLHEYIVEESILISTCHNMN